MRAKKYRISNLGVTEEMKKNSQRIQSAINQLEGINAVRIDPYAETVTVDFDDSKVSEEEIQKILRDDHYL